MREQFLSGAFRGIEPLQLALQILIVDGAENRPELTLLKETLPGIVLAKAGEFRGVRQGLRFAGQRKRPGETFQLPSFRSRRDLAKAAQRLEYQTPAQFARRRPDGSE